MTKFLLVSCLLFWSCHLLIAQTINVPTVSSQYLNQANDNSAIKLYLNYDAAAKKATFLINGKAQEFSQKTWQDYRKSQVSKLEMVMANQLHVQVHAPKNMPVSYLQDLYFWVQISGNHYLHLVAREGSEMKYIPLSVMPFLPIQKAATTYGIEHNLKGKTPLEVANHIHPNTTTLKTTTEEEELALVKAKKNKQTRDYIPHQSLSIQLKGDNNIVYKDKITNPMVLGSMIQTAIAANYQGSSQEAAPSSYFWIDIQAEPTITYQTYIEALVAVQEGFYLYWDELAFTKYEKSYTELSTEEKFYIKQTSPMLVTQYDAIQREYINSKINDQSMKGKTWTEINK